MQLFLIDRSNRGRGKYRLAQNNLLGRGEACRVRIAHAKASREHCRIYVHDGMAIVEDLGSTNGTRVNGRAVQKRMHLKAGDMIEIASSQFVLSLGRARASVGVPWLSQLKHAIA